MRAVYRSRVDARCGLPLSSEAVRVETRLPAHRLDGSGDHLGGGVCVVGLLGGDFTNEREGVPVGRDRPVKHAFYAG